MSTKYLTPGDKVQHRITGEEFIVLARTVRYGDSEVEVRRATMNPLTNKWDYDVLYFRATELYILDEIEEDDDEEFEEDEEEVQCY